MKGTELGQGALAQSVDVAALHAFTSQASFHSQQFGIPFVGFNIETLRHKNVVFTVTDLGYQEKMRPLWKHYFINTDAVIFVLNTADRDRMGDAIDAFQVSSVTIEPDCPTLDGGPECQQQCATATPSDVTTE